MCICAILPCLSYDFTMQNCVRSYTVEDLLCFKVSFRNLCAVKGNKKIVKADLVKINKQNTYSSVSK